MGQAAQSRIRCRHTDRPTVAIPAALANETRIDPHPTLRPSDFTMESHSKRRLKRRPNSFSFINRMLLPKTIDCYRVRATPNRPKATFGTGLDLWKVQKAPIYIKSQAPPWTPKAGPPSTGLVGPKGVIQSRFYNRTYLSSSG